MNQFPPDQPRSPGSVIVWILLLVFVVPLLLCGGLCGGLAVLGRRSSQRVQETVLRELHNADGYNRAWQIVSTAKEVTSVLGEPVKDHFPSQYQYHETGDDGSNAEFRYQISGPRGKAKVHVVGEKIEGEWWYEKIDVTFNNGNTVSLALEPRPIQLD